MAEQSGRSAADLRARLSALSERQGAVAEADRRLAAALAAAYASTLGALERLDRIEAEIESAVAAPRAFASDTTAGARELQRFLIAKQREIVEVIAEAAEQSELKAASVQQLTQMYR